MNEEEKIQGNVATTPTGAQVNLTTGDLISGPITGANLTPVPAVKFQSPPESPFTPAKGGPDLSTQDTTLQPTSQEQNISDLMRQFTEGNTALEGQAEFARQQREAQGVATLTRTQDDLNAKLQLLEANEVNIPLQLQQESIGRGRTAGGVAPIQIDRLRENAINANIIKAQLAGVQGKIATANTLVEQAVQDKFGPLEEKQKTRIANLEVLLKDPLLSLADKNRTEKQLQIQKAKDAQIAKDKTNYEEAQKEALKYTGIASAQQLDEMSKATSAIQVAQIAAKYGLKTLEQQKTEAEISKKLQENGDVLAGLNPEDPDYLSKLITASAGGKKVDAESIKSFSKGLNVIGQLGDLQTAIKSAATGPILGILRSANPYDVKAQAITAQLTALVPNLARGVYGEVGVLTDNDVALYSRTLPNLKSTEDVRNAILAMTVKTVQRSLENQLEVQAGFGRDVSGMLNIYKRVKAQAELLNKSIGIDPGSVQGIPEEDLEKEYQDFLNSQKEAGTLPVAPTATQATQPRTSPLSGIGQGVGDFSNLFSLFQ